jgi:biopolymer transport protein ExbD
LSSLRFYAVYLVLLILFISGIIIIKYELPVLLLAEAQQEQSNTTTTATDLAKMRNNTIIPQAQDVNESNLELIKICTASPNLECDNNMINIHNDCIAYPEYIAIHIPSCDDSRLISYLIARGLLE